ncbi:hypothetical protein [Roseiarcus sp.]|uniref:hypothetical protein n=1 Tax=Roseiarcus sp. TaxID=1969460 RepID=UPI003F953DBA
MTSELHPTADGVEVCEHYLSRTDALAVIMYVRHLIAMVAPAGDEGALMAYEAAIEGARLRA